MWNNFLRCFFYPSCLFSLIIDKRTVTDSQTLMLIGLTAAVKDPHVLNPATACLLTACIYTINADKKIN